MYEKRDIELEPPPKITAVLTVAFIPPEESSGGSIPRVSCFHVDGEAKYGCCKSHNWADSSSPMLMECAPSRLPSAIVRGETTEGASTGKGATSSSRDDAEPAGGTTGKTSSAKSVRVSKGKHARHPSSVGASIKGSAQPSGQGDSVNRPGKGQPLRRSSLASTMASSNTIPQRPRLGFLPPSSEVPLEKVDTFFLIGTRSTLLLRTTRWLNKAFPEVVVLGGISEGVFLVVGDQVRACPTVKGTFERGGKILSADTHVSIMGMGGSTRWYYVLLKLFYFYARYL